MQSEHCVSIETLMNDLKKASNSTQQFDDVVEEVIMIFEKIETCVTTHEIPEVCSI